MLKIFKNKTTLWCSIILFIFIFSAITPTFAFGATYKYATTTVTTTAAQSSTKVIIKPQTSMFVTTQIQSNLPGNFSMTDYDGNVIGSNYVVPNSSDANLYYPTNIGNNIEYNNTGSVDEAQARYVNIANNSADFGNYSVSLVTDKHDLTAGNSIDFFFNNSLCEVDLSVDKAGIYQIWYNNIVLNPIIESPTQTSVNSISGQLPHVSSTSSISLGKYFYFMATEKGVYQIYLSSSSPYVNLRCEYHAPTSISFGQAISGGVDINSPDFANPQYSMDVYSFSANVMNYYSYFLQYDFGSPNAIFFISTPYTTDYSSMSTTINGVYDPEGTGTVYIVIDNPSYFSWNNYGVKIPSPIKYTLKLNEIVPKSFQANNGSELITVGQNPGGEARSIDISNTSVMSMELADMGQSSPYVWGGAPYLERIINGYSFQPNIYNTVYSTSTDKELNILLSPGMYKILFYHQGNSGIEFMQFNTTLNEVSNTSVILKNVTTPLNNVTDFTNFTLKNWGNQSISHAESMGNGLTFNIDPNFRDYGYNLTIDPSKNPSVFDKTLKPDLGYLWNATSNSFVNYSLDIASGNGAPVPLKTSGSTNGDAFILGSYEKFKSITLDISQPASVDAFTWQYLSTTTVILHHTPIITYNWQTFTPSTNNFVDNTNINGSLKQSGTISWDPSPSTMPNWNYYSSTSNDTTNILPNTNNTPLYLIRVVCNNSASNIPTIKSVSLKQFVNIEISLNTQLGFDTNFLGTSCFDSTSYSNDFSNTQINNTEIPPSITGSGFGLNTNFYYKTGVIFFSGSLWTIMDYNGSNDGTPERLNQSLIFSVSVYRLNDYKEFNYTMGQNIPINSTDQLNMTTYNGYDANYSYNASEYSYVYIRIDPRTKYDWTQLNVQVQNGTLIDYSLLSPFNYTELYVASDNEYQLGNTWKIANGATNANLSSEFGFVTNYMLLKLEIAPINTSVLTTVNVFSGQYNYPFLTFVSTSARLPTSWQWWYTLLIVLGAVAIGSAVTYSIYKKKNPMFSLRDKFRRI